MVDAVSLTLRIGGARSAHSDRDGIYGQRSRQLLPPRVAEALWQRLTAITDQSLAADRPPTSTVTTY